MKIKYLSVFLLAGCVTEDLSGPQFTIPEPTQTRTVVPPQVTPRVPDPVYETLESNSSATSQLVGTAVPTNITDNTSTYEFVTGSIEHNNGQFVINHGYTLTDADGFDAQFKATDGVEILTQKSTGSNYKYMQTYEADRSVAEKNIKTLGIYGIPTRSEDLPSSGSARYTGNSTMGYTNKNGAAFTHFSKGSVTVSADFASKTVDMNAKYVIVRQNDANGAIVFTPVFDEMDVRGMTLNGSRYGGGSYGFFKNGAAVNPIGANSAAAVAGHFFGGESTGTKTQPAETGGTTIMSGDDGNVVTIFAAD